MLAASANDVVRLRRLVQLEAVSREHRRIEPAVGDQLACSFGVVNVSTSPVVIGDIPDPEALQMERRRMSVDADVRNPAARPDQVRAELERLGNADRLDRDVRAEPAGELHDRSDGVDLAPLLIVTSAPNSSAFSSRAQFGDVDRHDLARREELRGHDRREPDRACADDRDA